MSDQNLVVISDGSPKGVHKIDAIGRLEVGEERRELVRREAVPSNLGDLNKTS